MFHLLSISLQTDILPSRIKSLSSSEVLTKHLRIAAHRQTPSLCLNFIRSTHFYGISNEEEENKKTWIFDTQMLMFGMCNKWVGDCVCLPVNALFCYLRNKWMKKRANQRLLVPFCPPHTHTPCHLSLKCQSEKDWMFIHFRCSIVKLLLFADKSEENGWRREIHLFIQHTQLFIYWKIKSVTS